MSEIGKYLRFLINADKEAVVTTVAVTATPTQFTTQLTGENTRRRIAVYNNSDSGSGECYYSFSNAATPSTLSMIIPKGLTPMFIPIADVTAIELYFFCDTGELGDLRVMELS